MLALLLALSLLPAGCKGTARATTMHLLRTLGSAFVTDEAGKDVKLRENLNLYSGYQVGTEPASYAWIDLDSVKLAKLDAESAVEIRSVEKELELFVRSGSLFFRVNEPLPEDETMTIRTSSMAVGIRGTCGWVEVSDEQHMNVYILEGTVECSVTAASGKYAAARVSGGEMAALSLSETDEPAIVLQDLTPPQIAPFVREELEADKDLAARVEEASGLDLAGLSQADSPAVNLDALRGIHYYGDLSACAMTPEQALAFVQVLEENEAILQADGTPDVNHHSIAALVDLGGGVPGLFYAGAGQEARFDTRSTETSFDWNAGPWNHYGVWCWENGAAVRHPSSNGGTVNLFTGCMVVSFDSDDGSHSANSVYPYENGHIAASPALSREVSIDWENGGSETSAYLVDGAPASADQYNARWSALMENGEPAVAGFRWTGGAGGSASGGGSPAALIAALRAYAGEAASVPDGGAEEPFKGRTTRVFDPDTRIERTTLDPQGHELVCFYEIPVFEETGEGYAKINAHFAALRDAFFAPDGEAQEVWDMSTPPYANTTPYNDCWYASVVTQTEQLVGVTLSYDWYMGGVLDYGMESFVFDPRTGARLTLADLAGTGEEGLKDMVETALLQEYPGMEDRTDILNNARAIPMEDYDFYVMDAQIHIHFDKYEIAEGAAGEFDITLPLAPARS